MAATFVDSNGENTIKWPKLIATRDELNSYFDGFTGAMKNNNGNVAVFPDPTTGLYQLQNGATYTVKVPPKAPSLSGITDQFTALSILDYSALLKDLATKYGKQIVIPSRLPADLQKPTLGFFAKADNPLPFREGNVDMRLDRFGDVEESLPAAHIVLERLKKLPNSPTARKLMSLIGGSGYGKTTALFEVGCHHFMIFFKCGVSGGADAEAHYVQQGWSDNNFINMVNLIDVEFATKDETSARTNASTIFLRHLTARLMLLRLMFDINPDLSPEDFLLFQLDGGRLVIERISTDLRNVAHKEILAVLEQVFDDLYNTKLKGKRLICTFDEANVGYEYACAGKFRSPKSSSPRGLLSKILQDFSTTSLGLSILLAGTYWTLGLAENVESDVADKYGEVEKPITIFKLNMEHDVVRYLSTHITVDDVGDLRTFTNFDSLIGRGRLCGKVLELIPYILVAHPDISKKLALEKAITQSVKLHRESLVQKIRELYKTPGMADVISRIYAGSIFGQYFVFASKDSNHFDPIDVGMSMLVKITKEGVHWRIVEKIVIDAIQDVIKKQSSPALTMIRFNLGHLESAVELFGTTIQFKGNLLERIMAGCFMLPSLQNLPISELPFVKAANLKLPDWCTKTLWSVEKVCTPSALGFDENPDLKSESDVQALAFKGAISKCLYLKQVLGPEFILRLGASGEYWVTIGIKLYSKKVPGKTAEENVNITMHANMNKRCPASLKDVFSKIPYKGILRIVVNFPCAPEKTVLRSVVNGDDVQVYIDQRNASSFFSGLPNTTQEAMIAMLAECSETATSDWK